MIGDLRSLFRLDFAGSAPCLFMWFGIPLLDISLSIFPFYLDFKICLKNLKFYNKIIFLKKFDFLISKFFQTI